MTAQEDISFPSATFNFLFLSAVPHLIPNLSVLQEVRRGAFCDFFWQVWINQD